jgi:isoleucyl-tRNA synthetase
MDENKEQNSNIGNEEIKPKSQAEKEAEVTRFWQEHKIFEKSVAMNKGDGKSNNYVFYDGPPFATGLPHHGTLLQSFMKDTVPRYQTMNGKSVRRIWGWDCHGLPIENLIQKELGLNTKQDIENGGLDNFYKACADSVLRYEKQWKEIIPRTGRWVDMDSPYKTMDSTYTESVWWAFSQMYKKGLAYEGYKVMHVCPRCETPLAQSEVAGEYKDVTDISVYVPFEMEDESSGANVYMLAWTTTPWTLPGNTAIAVNKDLEYTKVKVTDEVIGERTYILSEKFVQKLFIDKNINYEIVGKVMGSELIGRKYKPIFDYYLSKEMRNKENVYKVWHADFVNDEMGTGIAHEAPVFGEDDMNLAVANEIPLIRHVKINGEFEPEVTDFAGIKVKSKDDTQSADIAVIKWLAHNGKLFAKEKIVHSYPHCWRCGTPLLNYGTSSWFIAVTELKDRLMKENSEIKWIPENIRDGRFGNWLAGARDWAVSRNRYWGAPLPVWKSEITKEVFVPGSLSELKEKIAKKNNYTFMRHGQIDGNLSMKVCLDKDADPLNQTGIEQVELAAEKINQKYDLIISSPYLRTRQTAEIVAEALGFDKSNIVIDDRLAEWNIGHELNDKSWKDLNEEFYNSGKDHFYDAMSDGGESKDNLQKRVGQLLFELDAKYESKNILLVTHRATLCSAISVCEGEIFQRGTNNKKVWRTIENAESLELDFRSLPHDDTGAINFHVPFIDEVIVLDSEGNKMQREAMVFDCWYESGSMSYAQFHYPFENKEMFEANYPANFIGEGLDQTRGWFYTSLILGVALFDKKSFEKVICTGLIMADDGRKISKSLGNYTDPTLLIDTYGSDAIRYYILSSPVVKGESFKFSDKGLNDVYRKNIVRLMNVLSMYDMYRDDTVTANDFSTHVIDKFILARLKEVKLEVTSGFESLELDRAFRPIEGFVDDLSVWYLRRSRERIKSVHAEVRNEMLATLRFALFEFAKIIAPIMPFIAEMIYMKVKDASEMNESVHLLPWGHAPELSVDEAEAIINTEKVRKIITAILDERGKEDVKVRQPLASVQISKLLDFESKDKLKFITEIKDEVNIKEISFVEMGEGEIAKLNTEITEELKIEGAIRELARAVQDMRKEKKMSTKDLTKLSIYTEVNNKQKIEDSISKNSQDFKKQCNLSEIEFVNVVGEDFLTTTFLDCEIRFHVIQYS